MTAFPPVENLFALFEATVARGAEESTPSPDVPNTDMPDFGTLLLELAQDPGDGASENEVGEGTPDAPNPERRGTETQALPLFPQAPWSDVPKSGLAWTLAPLTPAGNTEQGGEDGSYVSEPGESGLEGTADPRSSGNKGQAIGAPQQSVLFPREIAVAGPPQRFPRDWTPIPLPQAGGANPQTDAGTEISGPDTAQAPQDLRTVARRNPQLPPERLAAMDPSGPAQRQDPPSPETAAVRPPAMKPDRIPALPDPEAPQMETAPVRREAAEKPRSRAIAARLSTPTVREPVPGRAVGTASREISLEPAERLASLLHAQDENGTAPGDGEREAGQVTTIRLQAAAAPGERPRRPVGEGRASRPAEREEGKSVPAFDPWTTPSESISREPLRGPSPPEEPNRQRRAAPAHAVPPVDAPSLPLFVAAAAAPARAAAPEAGEIPDSPESERAGRSELEASTHNEPGLPERLPRPIGEARPRAAAPAPGPHLAGNWELPAADAADADSAVIAPFEPGAEGPRVAAPDGMRSSPPQVATGTFHARLIPLATPASGESGGQLPSAPGGKPPEPITPRNAAAPNVVEKDEAEPPERAVLRKTTREQADLDAPRTPSPEMRAGSNLHETFAGAEPRPARPAERASSPPRESVPAAVPEPGPEDAPRPAATAKDIRLEFSGGEQRIAVRLTERAGEVHVAVRTPDARLEGDLRDNLPALSARLEQGSGYRAENWSPQPAAAGRTQEAEASSGGRPDHSGGQKETGQRGGQQEQRRPRQQPEENRSNTKKKESSWFAFNRL